MHSMFLVFAASALFIAHVARGFPADPSSPPASSPPATGAPQASGAPQAEVKDTCEGNVNGTSRTFKVGERYCSSGKTHRVCNWGGEWIDGECPEGYHCLTHTGLWQVLCRTYIRHPYPTGPPAGQEGGAEPVPASQPSPSQPEPSKPEQPSQPSQPEPSKPEQPSQPSQPEPSKPEQPEPSMPSEPSQPSQSSEPAKPAQPTGSETCQAGGKTLKVGDAACTGQNSYVQCDNGGKNLERTCESGFECLPSGNGVICSNRNQIQKNRNQEPKDNQPSQPSQPEPSKPEQPSQPSQPEPSKPEQPEPSKPEQPESSKPSEPSQPSQSSEPAKPEPASQPAQPTGSETCQAGGKTLKLGDATCTGQNSYVQCDHGGKNLERTCESGFECLPSGNGVICSNRNQILKNRNQEPKNNQH